MKNYKNASLPIAQRVDDLLAQMTLEEKVAQLCCCTLPCPLDEDALHKLFCNGMGTVNYLNSALSGDSEKDIALLQAIQKYIRENTRLGIPVLAHSEAIAGAQIPGATTFPQSLGMAATWQPSLAKNMGDAVREQLSSFGIFAAHSPLLDLGRDPRWGRIGETYGEDSFLTAQMAVSFILGLQGNHEIMATAKHFLAYGNTLGGRNGGQADICERTLLDEYCAPFEAAIQNGHVDAVMNCYGTLNGEPTVSSRYLLTEILRDNLGFDGLVVSDYGSVERTFNRFGTAVSRQDAAIQALCAGIDVDQPDGICFHTLVDAVQKGNVDIAVIDTAVRRVLSLKFQLKLFESSAPKGNFFALTQATAPRQLSQAIAEKSIVLAKNNNILPLKKGLKIAVIGPSADDQINFFGGYSSVGTINATDLDFNRSELDNFRKMMLEIYTTQHRQELNEHGIAFEDKPSAEQEEQILQIVKDNFAKKSNHKIYKGQEDFLAKFYPECKTVREVLVSVIGKDNVLYAPGSGIKLPLDDGISDAVHAAQQADVVLAVIGGRESMRSPDATCGENKDNTNIGLEPIQRKLMDALYAVGKPVITVLVDGRPLALPEEEENSAAVLYAWLPGEHGADAIVNVLLGKVNPGGKMPLTVLRHAGQIPMRYDLQPLFDGPTAMAEYLDTSSSRPLYPFGHGLSYAEFVYKDLSLTNQAECGEYINIQFTIQNISDIEGDEIAQIYWRDISAPVVRPMRKLCAFARITLKAGEKKTVHIRLDTRTLAYHGYDMKLGIEPGERYIMIGASCEDIRLHGKFTLLGNRLIIDHRTYFPKISIS